MRPVTPPPPRRRPSRSTRPARPLPSPARLPATTSSTRPRPRPASPSVAPPGRHRRVNGQTATITIVDSHQRRQGHPIPRRSAAGAWSVNVSAAQAQGLADGSYSHQGERVGCRRQCGDYRDASHHGRRDQHRRSPSPARLPATTSSTRPKAAAGVTISGTAAAGTAVDGERPDGDDHDRRRHQYRQGHPIPRRSRPARGRST